MRDIIPDNICVTCNFINCLRQKGVEHDNLELLNHNKREVHYQKGETIFKQGAQAKEIAFVREGVVKLLVEGVHGRRFTVKLVVPDNYIGFSTLKETHYYPFSVIALKDTQICLIDKDCFKTLLTNSPKLSQYISNWFSIDYQFNYHRFAVLGTKQIHGRFADVLLYLDEKDFQQQSIYEYISRKDLAELAGMSVDSVLKLINELKSDRIIEVEGKSIIIKDIKAIQQLCKFG